MNKFIDRAPMISSKEKYSFLIANTDNSEKPGDYWWSILGIDQKTDIFFFLFLWSRWTETLHCTGQ